jgi:tRNA(Ile)-lysidine synthase
MKHIIEKIDQVLPRDARVLIGVSGGVDSISLLDLFANSGVRPFVVVHFNHGLREESNAEAAALSYQFQLKHLSYEVVSLDVRGYAAQHRVSTELAGRNLRYEMYSYLMSKYNCDVLALGHHQDDRIETFLFNLFRGSTVHGLHPMDFYDPQQKIIRPFIDTPKAEIIAYAKANRLEWYEDHTNAESDYDRNWLRNEVIPQLEARRAGTKKVITRTVDHFAELDDFLNHQVDAFVSIQPKNGFVINMFLNQHSLVQKETIRRLWITAHGSNQGFSSRVIHEAMRWIPGAEGNSSIWFGPSVVLKRVGSVIKLEEA